MNKTLEFKKHGRTFLLSNFANKRIEFGKYNKLITY